MSNQTFATRVRGVSARTWGSLVLVVIALIFILQNRDYTRIYILNFVVSAPLWAVLLITLVVGILIGLMLGHRNRRR